MSYLGHEGDGYVDGYGAPGRSDKGVPIWESEPHFTWGMKEMGKLMGTVPGGTRGAMI